MRFCKPLRVINLFIESVVIFDALNEACLLAESCVSVDTSFESEYLHLELSFLLVKDYPEELLLLSVDDY